MDRPKFKIGETSRLVGLSPETIRYYEKKQIIRPRKESGSGYRQFDILDVCILSKARNYLHYGFSLEEAQELLCAESTDTILNELSRQEASIEKNIALELAKLKGLRQKLADIKAVQENLGKLSLRRRPKLYCYRMFENNLPVRSKENTVPPPPISENQMLVFPYLEFPLKEKGSICLDRCDVGYALWKEDACHLDSEARAKLTLLPPTPCLYTAVVMPSDTGYASALQPVLQELASRGITPAGNVFCRTVTVHRGGSAYLYYRDVWIPVPEGTVLN